VRGGKKRMAGHSGDGGGGNIGGEESGFKNSQIDYAKEKSSKDGNVQIERPSSAQLG